MATITGTVFSVNVNGVGNADTSIQVSAVINDAQKTENVIAGAGNSTTSLVRWARLLLAAYLDGRTGGKKRKVQVLYDADSKQIEAVFFPPPKRSR